MAITKTPTRSSYDCYPDYDSSCSSSIATTIPDSTRTSFSLSSLSNNNTQSNATHHNSNKPHKANQAGWEAMRHLRSSQKGGQLGLEHFKLVRRVGSGDIGNVYLCQLRNHNHSPGQSGGYYAMKIVDREALAMRNKLQRAEMEKEILGMLDHPFLPTLYAEFDTSHYSCLVMEYCPGGDLHAARQRQPRKRFSISSSKFYAAEALLALEYLHMMGIVYRDLKPENVLVREDGHIMLSDFDLSLKCDVVPKLLRTQHTKPRPSDDQTAMEEEEKTLSTCYTMIPSCATPMQPVLSCFFSSNHLRKNSNPAPRTRTITTHVDNPNANYFSHEDQELDPELVAEPVNARSKSFVGTHEYLAPEVISGQGHGGAVDWWTLGIFLYEMIYGRTPFKGENNEKTLMNILKQPLSFPTITNQYLSSSHYREHNEEMVKVQDLISKLLVKNPKKRIGSLKGSVEIKRHEFFKGVNWALIRSVKPPEVPSRDNNNLHKIRSSSNSSSRGLMTVPKLTKKEREAPYQIPRHHHHPHHFDFF